MGKNKIIELKEMYQIKKKNKVVGGGGVDYKNN